MKGRILVAYASRYGSTREVAEHLSQTLRRNGFEVDCRSMTELSDISDYPTIVLGAPFYFGRWPGSARHFLGRFGPVLAHRDIAVFATGRVDPDQSPAEARQQLDLLLRRCDWLRPFASEMFGGRWDPSLLRGAHRWLLWFPGSPLKRLPVSDLRDWRAVDGWAERIGEVVRSTAAQPNPTRAPHETSRSDVPLTVLGEYIADQQRPPRDKH